MSILVTGPGYLGNIEEDEIIHFIWSTADVNGASVTPGTAGNLRIYKNNGVAQKTTANGITDVRTFDTLVGMNAATIDTSDDTGDAGFWVADANYVVMIEGLISGGNTVNKDLAHFSIERRFSDMRAVSRDKIAADNFETMLDGTGGNTLSLGQLNIVAGGNNSAIVATGAGTGAGVAATGGATNANGIDAQGSGNGHGLNATGGANGNGIDADGGSTSGHGIEASGGGAGRGIFAQGTGNNSAITATANGSGSGINTTGGSSGNGILATGGSVSGHGMQLSGDGNGRGLSVAGTGNNSGINTEGLGTGAGIRATGGATGAGINANGGSHGIEALAGSVVNSHGIEAVGGSSGGGINHGIRALGGATSGDGIHAEAQTAGDGIEATGAGGGFDFNAALLVTEKDDIADRVWDEVLTGATHNIVNSAGRRLRQLQEAGGYDGFIWIDTINGTAGTTDFENGTSTNPVDSIADANTLAASLGLNRFFVYPSSSITFAASQQNQVFEGEGWTLALGGQDISGTVIQGATVSGIGTSSTGNPIFNLCRVNAVTLPPATLLQCRLASIITVGATGDFFFDQCFSGVAGTGTPAFDFGAGIGNTNVSFRHYSGGIELRNMNATGTDVKSLEGDGQLVLAASCTGGTVAIRGNFTVTDNAAGAVTLSDLARFENDKNADHIWRRNAASIRASVDGDTVDKRSGLGAMSKLTNKIDTTTNPGNLTVFEENDTTEFYRQALVTDANADPIVEADTV